MNANVRELLLDIERRARAALEKLPEDVVAHSGKQLESIEFHNAMEEIEEGLAAILRFSDHEWMAARLEIRRLATRAQRKAAKLTQHAILSDDSVKAVLHDYFADLQKWYLLKDGTRTFSQHVGYEYILGGDINIDKLAASLREESE